MRFKNVVDTLTRMKTKTRIRVRSQDSKVYRILSLGQRGVGKTVFLAGAYLDMRESVDEIRVESLDSITEQNIVNLLGLIQETGDYPPPSVKVDCFNFGLQMSVGKQKPVSYNFLWNDVPGEICQPDNEEFQKQVFESHGCCVFFDANALVTHPGYAQSTKLTVKQLLAVASLTAKNGVFYPISLVFTKVDLLGAPPGNILRIEERSEFITKPLDDTGVRYRTFYSAVQLVERDGKMRVSSRGAAGAALFWLTQELASYNQRQEAKHLEAQLHSLSFPSLRTYAAPARNPIASRLMKPKIAIGAGMAAVVVIATAFGWTAYENQVARSPVTLTARSIAHYREILKEQPNDVDALINLSNLLLQIREYNEALDVTKRLVASRPEQLDFKINLARLYVATDRPQAANLVYDNILKVDGDNIAALKEKAILVSQTDKQEAQKLTRKAIQYASPADKPELMQMLEALRQ